MKLWAIMRRDLLKLMRNPLTLLSTILMPIVYLVIIGNSFQGTLKNLPLAVVAEDRGIYAIRMMEKLQAKEIASLTVELDTDVDRAPEPFGNVGAGFDARLVAQRDTLQAVGQNPQVKRFLGREIEIERALGDAGLVGHAVHRNRLVGMAGEEAKRGGKDARALAVVVVRGGARGLRSRACAFGVGLGPGALSGPHLHKLTSQS